MSSAKIRLIKRELIRERARALQAAAYFDSPVNHKRSVSCSFPSQSLF
jgi:hypothetical protein